MIRFKLFTVIALGLLATPVALLAQPRRAWESTDEAGWPRHRAFEQRFEAIAEYLELSEEQAVQCQALFQQHREEAQMRHQTAAELRQEFRELAAASDPDLEGLGAVALEMHRQMESLRGLKEQLAADVEAVLTPDQVEKFEAFRAARDVAGPRHGRHGPGRFGDRPPID
jgi:Spy/CpxP family protein refolding chaperone